MDLKEYKHNKIWILHLINASFRYCASCIVKTKNKGEIIKQICSIWIAYFGSLYLFSCDNDEKFSNDLFRATAGESPFSNGIVERYNKVLSVAFSKTLEDMSCGPEVVLACVLSVKIELQNNGDFTTDQLFFDIMSKHPISFDRYVSSFAIENIK